MAQSEQKIRIYVSKIETETGEILAVNSNINTNNKYANSGVSLSPQMKEKEIVERIINYMTRFFMGIIPNLESDSVKYDVQYLFNTEYSAKGQLLYGQNNGQNKDTKYFNRMYWVDLKKPLTPREIELFVKALRQIPDFDK